MNQHFTIAIDTCNHENWIERCLNTCLTQKYDNFEVILIDAVSEDKTWDICKKYAEEFKNLKIHQNEIRLPQVANFKFLNDISKDNSIVVSIDGDDWLKHKKVLEKLSSTYSSEDVWMTYGTYEEFPYRNVSEHYFAYPDDIIETNAFREYKWLASHLRTWRKELFKKIPENAFLKEDGTWLDTVGDQAIMLPMLEMSGKKSHHISDILYVYNVANSSRDGVLNEARQLELATYVRCKSKCSVLEKL